MTPQDPQPAYGLQPVAGPYGINYFVAVPTEDDSAVAAPDPDAEPACVCRSPALHEAGCKWLAWKRRTRS